MTHRERVETALNHARKDKDELTEILAQSDRIKSDKKRIADLEALEKSLANRITEIEEL